MVLDDLAPGLRPLALRYEFIRELGRGGMATVYLARERASGRIVAIKAVDARHAEDKEALARFAREARTVAVLDHPNIVRTYAVEQAGDEAVAIVMQHVGGGTLREILRRDGPFGFEPAERVLTDVAEALRYAHARGLVHRDVKPENVFLEEGTGRALLSDFGIARAVEEDVRLTLTGTSIGTPTYMSPEQIDGRRLDGRTDIYSLGLLGWEILAGSRPWEGESLYKVIYKQKHEELPRLTALRPRIPENLLFAIEGALHKDRDTRWANVDEFLTELAGRPAPATIPGAVADGRRDASETRAPVGAVVAEVVATPAVHDARDAPTPSADSWARWTPSSAEPDDDGDWSLVPALREAWVSRRHLLPLALVALASIGFIGAFAQRRTSAPRAPAAAATPADTGVTRTSSAGAVDEPAAATPPVDSSLLTARPSAGGVLVDRRDETPAAASPAASAPSRTTPPAATSRAPRPAARRRTPSRSGTAASAAPARVQYARDHGDSLALCYSPAAADQRACLTASLADQDRGLNNVYQTLIGEMRKQAGVAAGAPDPPSVARLRVEQRAWLVERDGECARQARDEGALWARPRARCLGVQGTRRAGVLADALTRLRAP